METKKGERLSDFRLEQAMETGAGILAVACPYCLINLEDSKITISDGSNIEIRDVVELVWEVIQER